MHIPSLLLVIAGLSACAPPIIEETGDSSDPGTGTDVDTDTDTEADTDTEVDTDTEAESDLLVVSDQVVQLTTVVVIDRVRYLGPDRFVVVQEDLDGAAGVVVGSALVTSGDTLDLNVELSAPLSGRTQLLTTLFNDTNNNGVFDEGTDLDIESPDLMDGFQATVVPGTPAVRLVLVDGSDAAILVTQVIPAYEQEALAALDVDNPTLRLARGVRYEIQNSSDVRLEFVMAGATPTQDMTVLAQGDVVGMAEDQAGIDWEDSNGFLRFTATPDFLLNVDGYRDGDDVVEARGVVTPQINR
ncbi:MAG: hypothetical protein ACJAZO_005313 [Myxococcota bacterium]|jgi:hypothetical protein